MQTWKSVQHAWLVFTYSLLHSVCGRTCSSTAMRSSLPFFLSRPSRYCWCALVSPIAIGVGVGDGVGVAVGWVVVVPGPCGVAVGVPATVSPGAVGALTG